MFKYKKQAYKNNRELILKIAEDTNIQYPLNIFTVWTEQELSEIGVNKIIPEPRPDESIFIVGDLNADGTWNKTARSADEIKRIFILKVKREVQIILDKKAVEQGYDNIFTAATYAGYTNDFQEEGQKLAIWRSSCWSYCFNILTQYENGQITKPTVDSIVSGLPEYI